MFGGLYVFLILLITLRDSMKMFVSWRWFSLISSRAFIIAIDSAIKTELMLGSLSMNFMLFQITAAPTPSLL